MLKHERLPQGQRTLLGWTLAYIAAPLRDIPLIGLSFSSLVMGLLIVAQVRGERFKAIVRSNPMAAPLSLFLIGLVISTFWNAFIGRSQAVPISRSLYVCAAYSYWAMVFLALTYVIRRYQLAEHVLQWLTFGVVILALGALLDRFVGFSNVRGSITQLTQNEIGYQLSCFALAPLGLSLAKTSPGRFRLAAAAMAIVGLAVVINASRGSWIGLVVGLASVTVLSRSFRFMVRLALVSVAALTTVFFAALPFAPPEALAKFEAKRRTFERLEYDKSYQARSFQVEKAWHLFKEHPLVGVGPGMFHNVEVAGADVPKIFQYRSGQLNRMGAHNAYLLLLSEGGLVTTLPIASFLVILGVRNLVAWRRKRGQDAARHAVIVGMLAAGSIHLWAVTGLGTSATWLVYALAAAEALGPLRESRQLPFGTNNSATFRVWAGRLKGSS
jgi:O-antigen ligase